MFVLYALSCLVGDSERPVVFHPPFGCGEGDLDNDIGVPTGDREVVGVAGIAAKGSPKARGARLDDVPASLPDVLRSSRFFDVEYDATEILWPEERRRGRLGRPAEDSRVKVDKQGPNYCG